MRLSRGAAAAALVAGLLTIIVPTVDTTAVACGAQRGVLPPEFFPPSSVLLAPASLDVVGREGFWSLDGCGSDCERSETLWGQLAAPATERSACVATRRYAAPKNGKGILDLTKTLGPSAERPPPTKGCRRDLRSGQAQRDARKVQGLETLPSTKNGRLEVREYCQDGKGRSKYPPPPSVPESRWFGEITEREMHDAETRVRKYWIEKHVAKRVKKVPCGPLSWR